MKNTNISPRHNQILVRLSRLPHKMLSIHGAENTTEFVLHELCQPTCFNLKKAAYFIDNPDFDCLKGVAGFSNEEQYVNNTHCWSNPHEFTKHMQSCAFNTKVRGITRPSAQRGNIAPDSLVAELAPQLALNAPYVLSWPLKHDNQGVLIFERVDGKETFDDHMLHGLHLLAFCPVF
jgi:hypothetical protein